MSDEIVNQVENDDEVPEISAADERSLLMQRARMMGVKISNNIGLEALKAKLKEHTEQADAEASSDGPEELEQSEPEVEAEQGSPSVPPRMAAEALPKRPPTKQEIRKKLIAEATKLVRLRITNMDPKKRDLPGEIFTVANSYIGTVRKYVPFGEVTEEGYHVPYCIYQMLKDRKFLNIKVIKRRGREIVEHNYVPEFALEVLPPLTVEELKKLAAQQALAANNS